jgi:hypothetical protein
MFTKGQKCPNGGTKMSPSTGQKCPPNIKEINIKEEERRASPPSNPLKPAFEFKRIKMDQEKFENLVKDFGKNTVDEMLDRLDEYADINPKRFKQYACHAAVIRKWIRDDKGKSGTKPALQHVKDIVEHVKNNYGWDNRIDFFPDGLGFNHSGGRSTIVSFNHPEFGKEVTRHLKNLGFKLKEGV